MAPERRHGPDDRTQVARIGDVVQCHHQRGRAVASRAASRSSGCAYWYGGTCSAMPWCSPLARDPIQVVPWHLEYRDAGIGCHSYGFGEPLVGLGAQCDVQRGRGHPGPQALQHRIAAEHDLGLVGLAGRPPLLLLGLGRAFGGGMVGPHVGRRRGAPTLQAATADTAGPDRRPLLRTGLTNRAPAA